MDIDLLTIKKAGELLKSGQITSVSLTEKCLEIIKEKDGDVKSFIEVYEDVIEQAKVADERIKSCKDVTPLTGIPIAVKDNILVEGRSVTAGSKILNGYKATYDSTVAKKLKDAGAVILGRTNMDEFAMGSSTENSAYGVTRNPHNLDKVSGGSSGGSAAAVGMGSVLASLGSDTGGSIRQPSSYCGVVGLKPTYGSISRHGLIAMGSSLDIIGPMTKTVSDSEIVFNCLSGKDKMDSTSVSKEDFPKVDFRDKPVIGVPRDFLEKGVDRDVISNFNQSIEKLKSLGYEVKDIVLPNAQYSLAVYYILMPAEASTNLGRYDGMKYGFNKSGTDLLDDYILTRGEGFGKEVRRRILLGSYVLSAGYRDAYYDKANKVRDLIKNDFNKAFKEVDIIVTPTTPSPAFGVGEKEDPLSMYLTDIFTTPANISGIPAISIPSGTRVDPKGDLPTGLQFMAPNFGESMLFKIGKEFLSETE